MIRLTFTLQNDAPTCSQKHDDVAVIRLQSDLNDSHLDGPEDSSPEKRKKPKLAKPNKGKSTVERSKL